MSKTSTFLKRLGGASMAVAGILGAANTAQAAVASNGLGDLAIVPYYTVQNNFITGVHITNVTDSTQVVKFRLRRDSDSADVLDFSVIMSPQDVFTGWLDDSAGQLRFYTDDNTCTAPTPADDGAGGKYLAPPATNTGLAGAEEGYIEIIGMGQTIDEAQRIAVDAKHNSSGTPASCTGVQNHFFANGSIVAPTSKGVIDHATTTHNGTTVSTYEDTDNQALKVSFFIRDAQTGMEFGGDALHIQGFGAGYDNTYGTGAIIAGGAPMMANQELGLVDGNTAGFEFPDLDGGGSNVAGPIITLRGRFDDVIRADIGANNVINDWSYNTANGVSTDWVVTFPGQYLMDDPNNRRNNVDDLPAIADITVYNREEGEEEPGGLVVSPGTGTAAQTLFNNEVNVIEWGGQSVFGSSNVVAITDPNVGQVFGWASLAVTSDAGTNATIFDLTDTTADTDCITDAAAPTNCDKVGDMDNNAIPMVGFTAWQRTFTDASKNYGRIIPHSFN